MDERGVSELLGFVLAFSLVVTTFAIYQADVIPHQNREAEVEYSQQLESELTGVRAAVGDVGSTGAPTTRTVPGGATYPKRALGINAPPPGGHLATTDRYDVELFGFNTTSQQYWNGTPRGYDTRLLRFQPNYNYYHEAESFYLVNGVALKHAPEVSYTARLSGEVVTGNQIDLTLLSGDIRRTDRSVSLPLRSVSSNTEYLSVNASNNAYVRVPTIRSQAAWSVIAADNSNISDVEVHCLNAPGTTPGANCPNAHVTHATIELEPGSYKLRVVNVSVSAPVSPKATYLTMHPSSSVTEHAGQTYVVTARDKFGNPVASADLDFSKSGPGTLTTDEARTNEYGQATFAVKSAEIGVTTVTARLDDDPPNPSYENVTLTVGNGVGTTGTVFTVYTRGQLRTGLSAVDSLTFNDGMMVPGNATDCLLVGDTGGGLIGNLLGTLNCGSDEFDTLQGQLRIETTNGEDLTVTYLLFDEDQDGQIDSDDDNRVVIESEASGKIFEGELKTQEVKDVLGAEGADLLDADSYASTEWEDCGLLSCDWGGSDSYDEFSDIDLSQADQLFVERHAGRVTVNASST